MIPTRLFWIQLNSIDQKYFKQKEEAERLAESGLLQDDDEVLLLGHQVPQQVRSTAGRNDLTCGFETQVDD